MLDDRQFFDAALGQYLAPSRAGDPRETRGRLVIRILLALILTAGSVALVAAAMIAVTL